MKFSNKCCADAWSVPSPLTRAPGRHFNMHRIRLSAGAPPRSPKRGANPNAAPRAFSRRTPGHRKSLCVVGPAVAFVFEGVLRCRVRSWVPSLHKDYHPYLRYILSKTAALPRSYRRHELCGFCPYVFLVFSHIRPYRRWQVDWRLCKKKLEARAHAHAHAHAHARLTHLSTQYTLL